MAADLSGAGETEVDAFFASSFLSQLPLTMSIDATLPLIFQKVTRFTPHLEPEVVEECTPDWPSPFPNCSFTHNLSTGIRNLEWKDVEGSIEILRGHLDIVDSKGKARNCLVLPQGSFPSTPTGMLPFPVWAGRVPKVDIKVQLEVEFVETAKNDQLKPGESKSKLTTRRVIHKSCTDVASSCLQIRILVLECAIKI